LFLANSREASDFIGCEIILNEIYSG